MTRRPAPPPPPPADPNGARAARARLAGMLAEGVRSAYGADAADILSESENVGDPPGYVPWGNIALERAVGSGFPLGRIVEVSGPEDCGKSTTLDQLLGSVQTTSAGIGVLADTERTRRREYMQQLGVEPDFLLWVRAATIEGMFERAEVILWRICSARNRAWADALARAGYKLDKLPTTIHVVKDPATQGQRNRKAVDRVHVVEWNNTARAAVRQFQSDNGLKPTGIRDAATAAILRPCVILDETADKATIREILAAWDAGIPDERVVTSEVPYVFGWDSVGGTPSERELEGSARDVSPAAAAKVIRLNLRRLVQQLDDQNAGWLMVNQEYENIDIGGGFGGYESKAGKVGAERDGKSTYGGKAIAYHSSVRIRLARVDFIYGSGRSKQDGYPPIGQVTEALVFKNKMSGRQAVRERYGLIYGRGACDAWTIFHDLKDRGIISQNGAWSRFTDQTIMPSVGIENGSWQRGWEGFDEYMNTLPGFADIARQLYLEGGEK